MSIKGGLTKEEAKQLIRLSQKAAKKHGLKSSKKKK